MNETEFAMLAKILKDRSGLILGDNKTYLLESRLVPVAKKHELTDLDGLVAAVKRSPSESLLFDITEAMTTNESFFFRDNTPFDTFKEHTLPALLESRSGTKHIRIWSAACSTGQEAYSLAMILKENAAKLANWRIEIIGTDLSPKVLEKAKAGVYSQFEVQRGLPVQYLVKYFSQVNELWQIDAAVRAMVDFRPGNLLEDFALLGGFDVVFCRNVLIYFERDTKSEVLERVSKRMPSDGVLFLGGAETVLGVSEEFKPIPGQRGVYIVDR
jgi:chemotaxis protein methyltransferase CheR